MEENYHSICTWHYRELAEFAPDIARPRLQEWHTYVRTHYPDSRMDSYAYRYQQLPFHVFYYYMKAHIFIERVQRFIKRKLHLK
ncbi:MAG: hypothetical protein ACI4TV_07280 [Paludibacteraceae bacterium]